MLFRLAFQQVLNTATNHQSCRPNFLTVGNRNSTRILQILHASSLKEVSYIDQLLPLRLDYNIPSFEEERY
jgi:hypothetical protein